MYVFPFFRRTYRKAPAQLSTLEGHMVIFCIILVSWNAFGDNDISHSTETTLQTNKALGDSGWAMSCMREPVVRWNDPIRNYLNKNFIAYGAPRTADEVNTGCNTMCNKNSEGWSTRGE